MAYLCFDEVPNPDFSHDGYGDSFYNGFDHGGVTLSCRVSEKSDKDHDGFSMQWERNGRKIRNMNNVGRNGGWNASSRRVKGAGRSNNKTPMQGENDAGKGG